MHNTSTLHQEIEHFTQVIAEELRLHELLDWLTSKVDVTISFYWNYKLQQ